jgi:glycosyltransferase involved in cell wall biosynthesis
MRILMLHNRYKIPGGEDVSTSMQVELLRSSGHSVELVEETSDRVDTLGASRTAVRAIWSQESYKRVSALLERSRFDVMHVQNFFPLFSPSVYYAARRHGVPVVQSLRNFRLICPEGMLYRDGQVCTECVGRRFASPGVKYGCYRGSRSGTSVVATMSATHRLAGSWRNLVSVYVTPSRFAAEMYVEGGWEPNSIVTIPNFVHPDPGVGSGTGAHALFVGRLAPPKGLETMLAAWRQDKVNFPLKIAGDGPLRHIVEREADQNPLITYLGPVTPVEASDLMGSATFVVVPTVGIETFGRVAAEALAKGTPGVVSDAGGLKEIIDEGSTGWLIPPGDSDRLADRVAWISDHEDDVSEMRPRARASFLDRFSSDQAIEHWISVYERAIAAGRP